MRILGTIVLLASLLMTSCYDEEINPRKVNLTVDIECIHEAVGYDSTTHTYLCSGTLGGFTGECTIVVFEEYYGEHRCEIQVAGDKTPFEFTMQGTLSNNHNNVPVTFKVGVLDKYGNTLCKTATVADKR